MSEASTEATIAAPATIHQLLTTFFTGAGISLSNKVTYPYIFLYTAKIMKELQSIQNFHNISVESEARVLLQKEIKRINNKHVVFARDLAELLSAYFCTLKENKKRNKKNSAVIGKSVKITIEEINLELYKKEDKEYLESLQKLRRYGLVIKERSLGDLLLFGSFATRDYITGHSDLDTSLLINKETCCNAKKLLELRSFATKIMKESYFVDPLQHHGPYIFTEFDCEAYAETFLPFVVWRNAVSFSRKKVIIFQKKNAKEETQMLLQRYKDTFINVLKKRKEDLPQSDYSQKFLYQVYLLFPSVYLLARGKPCYKRESFALVEKYLTKNANTLINIFSKIRKSNAFKKNPAPLYLQRFFRNIHHPFLYPILCRTLSRSNLSKQQQREVEEQIYLGTKDLIAAIDAISTKSVKQGKISKKKRTKHQFVGYPVKYKKKDYDNAIKRIAEIHKGTKGIHSIYRFGSVSEYGISDVDYFIVTEDSLENPSFKYTHPINKMTNDEKYIMYHKPGAIFPKELFSSLDLFCPIFEIECIYGENLLQKNKGVPQKRSQDLASIFLSDAFFMFYPRIFIEILRNKRIHVRNSLTSIKKIEYLIQLFERLGIKKKSWRKYSLDVKKLRKEWFKKLEGDFAEKELILLLENGLLTVMDMIKEFDEYYKKEFYVEAEKQEQSTFISRMRRVKFEEQYKKEKAVKEMEQFYKKNGIFVSVLPTSIIAQLLLYKKTGTRFGKYIGEYVNYNGKRKEEKKNLEETAINKIRKERAIALSKALAYTVKINYRAGFFGMFSLGYLDHKGYPNVVRDAIWNFLR